MAPSRTPFPRSRATKPLSLPLVLSLALHAAALTCASAAQHLLQTVQRPKPPADVRESYLSNLGVQDPNSVLKTRLRIALVMVGTFSPCAEDILSDLLRSFSLPPRYQTYSGTPLAGTVANVAMWWKGVATWGATTEVCHTLTRPYPLKTTVAQAMTAFSSEGGFVSDCYKSREAFNAKVKKQTMVIVVLGKGAALPPVAKIGNNESCGTILLKDDKFFASFMGGIVIPGPSQSNWNKNCYWQPIDTKSKRLSTPNMCPDADLVATHILTKLADFATNPQRYNVKSPNSRGLACKNVKDFPLCSGGTACDMREIGSKTWPQLAPQQLGALNTYGLKDSRTNSPSTLESLSYRFLVQSYAVKIKNQAPGKPPSCFIGDPNNKT